MREAYDTGCNITFDVITYEDDVEPMRLEKKLLNQEMKYLSALVPPLNYYINKTTKNPIAYSVKLEDILRMEKNKDKIPSAYAG